MKTFIFAAGASIPFFYPMLSTAYLTDKVKDVNEWGRVINKYRQYVDPSTMIVSAQEVSDVINQILTFDHSLNFEQIAEIIDKVSSINYDSLPSNNMLNLYLGTLHNLGMYHRQKYNSLGWRDIPFLYRQIIAEAILELENSKRSADYDILTNSQHDFIKYVSDEDSQVSIMSLNYDNNVLNSLEGLGFEKGFESTSRWQYGLQLNIGTFMNSPKVIYFPHGHLRFCFKDNNDISFFMDSVIANEERWTGLNQTMLGSTMPVIPGKFSYIFNTFITTGQTKDDILNTLPYAIYYQRLAVDITNSDTIYIIGYSFGDEHINRLLKSFLKIEPTNKVYIIDYYPDNITMTDEYMDNNNLILKIRNVFGNEWILNIDTHGAKTPANPAEISNLNSNGYGEIFPNVIFYKKGYDAFLREFSIVL